MKIKKYTKINNDKYKVIFEDNSAMILYEDVILNNDLLYKNDIDYEIYEKITKENEIYLLYNDCLKYISIRLRSEKEIINFLERKKTTNEVIDIIINKLKKNNYLNDDNFIKYFVADKINLGNNGPYKIINELKKYLDEEDIIINYIENIDNNIFKDKLNKIIKKYLNTNKKYSGNILKTKLYNYLVNLGYDKKMILDLLNNYHFDIGNISKEYEKLFKKYCIKYDEDKLNYIIKNKLYSKGYCIEEINEIMNK